MHASQSVDANDFYERLEISRTATADEIKRAYQRRLRLYPPERAPEEFKRIREAYETLGNQDSRRDYDDRPDPLAVESFDRAIQAMRSQDYPTAERLLKQVLLLDPNRGFVRNLLGLCYLYQGEAEKASEQFLRLLNRADAQASWYGNAARAALDLEEFDRAASLYLEALRRSNDEPAAYYAGLADVYIAQEDYTRARELLELAIAADGRVDFEDLRFFTKLLEVGIRQRDLAAVQNELARIEQIAEDDEQRRYLAWKLGMLAIQLISMGGFDYAEPIASLAQRLQPEDADYSALQQVSRMLGARDLDLALSVVRTHKSFQQGEWLEALGPEIESYCSRNRFLAGLRPLKSTPPLWSVNGIGTALYGAKDPDTATSSHVSVLWFTILFIPLVPLAIYRVIPSGDQSWRFLGKLQLTGMLWWWRTGVVAAIALKIVIEAGSSSASPAARASSATTVSTSATAGGAERAQEVKRDPLLVPQLSVFGRPTEAWFDAERTAIEDIEKELGVLDNNLESARFSMETYERRANRIKADVEAGYDDESRYQAAVRQYNQHVDDYNQTAERRRTLYGTYETRLAAFNRAVDMYNARR